MSNPDIQPHVGAAHSILGLLSSIAIGCNKLHSLQHSNSTDTTDQSSKTHRSQPLHTQVPKLTGRRPCTRHTPQNVNLTLARTGGGLVQPPPLRFFADSEKTAALSAAGFWGTLWGKPCATFGKKKLTRSGQVTEL